MTVRFGPLSFLFDVRSALITLLLAMLSVLLFAVTLSRGDVPLGVGDVLAIVFGCEGHPADRLVVLEWRMPRALAGAAVGIALGLSGALTQTLTRNSLASPDILGVTVGGSAAAVTVIVLGGTAGAGSGILGDMLGWLSSAGIPAVALCGALLTAALIWVISSRVHMDPFRLVLTGIIISALLGAYINFLLTTARIQDVAKAQFWLSGSLGLVTWERVLPVLVVAALALPLTLWAAHVLRPLSLGPAMAATLGTRVGLAQCALLLFAVVLAACAVSAAGPIGFIAFVAPQLALRLTGRSTPPLLASGLMGAVLLQCADLVARFLLGPTVSVGLVTSALGGAFLIYVLVRTARRSQG